MSSEHSGKVSAQARALADADFTQAADSFANAGFSVRLPARGILQVTAAGRVLRRPRLLLSVGIHGDETAPIEMLAHLLDALAGNPHALAVDLMLVVGNPAAIAAGTRFIDADLNRLFRDRRGDLETAAEAARADAILRATASFLAGTHSDTWHLDLHAAIRPSLYPSFAVVPAVIGEPRRGALLSMLGRGGIEAVILNAKPAATYSACTAGIFGAAAATVELGQVGAFGTNDPGMTADMSAMLDGLLRSGRPPSAESRPRVFRVTQELIRHSERFRMAFGRETKNFTALAPGTLIAEDGDVSYRVGATTEYVVFPNPDVRPGLRAGLMVAEDGEMAQADGPPG